MVDSRLQRCRRRRCCCAAAAGAAGVAAASVADFAASPVSFVRLFSAFLGGLQVQNERFSITSPLWPDRKVNRQSLLH